MSLPPLQRTEGHLDRIHIEMKLVDHGRGLAWSDPSGQQQTSSASLGKGVTSLEQAVGRSGRNSID